MKKLFIYCFFIAFCFISCEEQPVEIPEFIVQEGNRKVMIEEFTGVSCAPCFDGSAVIEDIIKSFSGRVIVNGIHGVFQASPTAESKYDFRYPDAVTLEKETFFLGKPATLIDRVHFIDQEFLTIDDRDSWKGKVVERLAVESPVSINATSSFDASSRIANINVSAQSLNRLNGIIKLFVLVNESNLVDPQLSNSMGLVLEFNHKHVMKEMLTSTNGDIIGENVNSGEVLTKSFTYTVPDEENGEWIPENMEVVIFLTGERGEVLQAEAIHLVQ